MEFDADGRRGVLRLSGPGSVRRVGRAWPLVGRMISASLEHAGLELRARIGPLPSVRIAPHPGLLGRLLLSRLH